MIRIALIGGVTSTLATLRSLIRHNITNVDIYGYAPNNSELVSGFVNLEGVARECGCSYTGFLRVNDLKETFIEKAYDYIFVVGLSQLICDDIIRSARSSCVGFHPTKLPWGRGRAPIAWLILKDGKGAATFFRIKPGAGVDAGAILAQSDFCVDSDKDTAANIEEKIVHHIGLALDQLLPSILAGQVREIPQAGFDSSEFGIRKSQDGFVDWACDAATVLRHIRASMPPHPGAFAFVGANKFQIHWVSSEVVRNIEGVIGRILFKKDDHYLIQTGSGSIWVGSDCELRVGDQLGVSSPYQLFSIEKRLSDLENILRQYQKRSESE